MILSLATRLVPLALLALTLPSIAQTEYVFYNPSGAVNEVAGLAPSNTSPEVVSASPLRVVGASGGSFAGSFHTLGWSNAQGPDLGKYVEFSVTGAIAAGRIRFDWFFSSFGPTWVTLRTSVDNFSTNIDTRFRGNVTTLNFTQLGALNGTTTFRLYFWGGSAGPDASTNTFFMDGTGIGGQGLRLLGPVVPDDCADKIALPPGFGDRLFSAVGATTDGLAYEGFCGDDGTGANGQQNYNDIWFTYRPEVGGCTYISTLGLTGYDTKLTIYAGDECPADPANIIACSDNEVIPAVAPFEAGLDVLLVAGEIYTIRLGTSGPNEAADAGYLRIEQGPGAAANSGGQNPGAPGCSVFHDRCNGDGGDGLGCTDCPCGNNAPAGTVGGCLNSAGTSTRLHASGTESIVATDLRFEASGVPPRANCILVSGNSLAPANPTSPCFGLNSGVTSANMDGLRCAAQGVLRHGVRTSDANGDVGLTTNGWGMPHGFVEFRQFLPGQTKHFQLIYRDDAATMCSTGQNTSQAVSVSFVL